MTGPPELRRGLSRSSFTVARKRGDGKPYGEYYGDANEREKEEDDGKRRGPMLCRGGGGGIANGGLLPLAMWSMTQVRVRLGHSTITASPRC
jgi:hypothetical protein